MTTDETAASSTAAYAGFTGEVGRIMSTSTPAWPRPPIAPMGHPTSSSCWSTIWDTATWAASDLRSTRHT
ncbi:MAG: hypothetical protein Ct9H300mP12_16670 [Acidimicrobiales bacterium]|nr:MAG: hypothetical protein Ct9H300mP12_16670 [Acidimicrobiales bacterium]